MISPFPKVGTAMPFPKEVFKRKHPGWKTLFERGRCRSGKHEIKTDDDVSLDNRGHYSCKKCRNARSRRYWKSKHPESKGYKKPTLFEVGFCRKKLHQIKLPEDVDYRGRCRRCKILATRKAAGTPLDLPFDFESGNRGKYPRGTKPRPAQRVSETGSLVEIKLHCEHTLLFKKGQAPMQGETLYCQRCADWSEVI